MYSQISKCRSCGSSELGECLNMGELAISNFFDTYSEAMSAPRAPLVLLYCNNCTLVQLKHSVDRDVLYANYWYRSATNESMVRALREIASAAMRGREKGVVLDIGANDGTLLQQFGAGWQRLAYEPADNLAAGYPASNIVRVGRYFPQMVQGSPVGLSPKASAITSIACFYDVEDPNAFVEGIKANLAEDGVWINQLAYLPATLRTLNSGDICHEHLTYWTVRSFLHLLKRHGLAATCSFNDVNGGSVRFEVRKPGTFTDWWTPDGVTKREMQRFRTKIANHRETILRYFAEECPVGYGASTKGNTYLQYWGINDSMMRIIVDRNPEKHGKYTPMGQYIDSEAYLHFPANKDRHAFVLPWHFRDSFIERERDWIAGGGKLVFPLPELEVVDASSLASTPAGSRPDSSLFGTRT